MKHSEVRVQHSGARDRRSERFAASDSRLPSVSPSLRFAIAACLLLLSFPMTAKAQRQTVLFLGEEGPLVIGFELKTGGQAFTETWRAGLRQIIEELDKDGNGTLSRKETEGKGEKKTDKSSESSPQAEALLRSANLWDADAEPRDGELNEQEIARFLSRKGQGAFQTEASEKTAALLSPQITQAVNSGDRLWDWLDDDDDQKLSPKELQDADETLRKYDLDADESISLNELEAIQNPFFTARQSNQMTETPFFSIHHGQSATRIIRGLALRYRSFDPPNNEKAAGSRGIAIEALQIPDSQKRLFDRDGSGRLDDWELREFLKSPVPMVTIQIELPASEKSLPKLTGRVRDAKSSIAVKKSLPGSVSILAGEIQIEIDANGLRPEALTQSLKERFNQADRDNNGYLEKGEANRDQFFRRHFAEYDADGNEKLYPEEWRKPVDAAIEFARSQTRMTVQDGGQDVFSVLDGDRDLKIGPREWITAADRMEIWDKNENGTLEKNEVPHVYRVSFGPGLPDLPGLITPQNNNRQSPAMQEVVRGPKWFQAMDKNGDGDVSAREFLGSPESFKKIDRDQDELIDPHEAAKFTE